VYGSLQFPDVWQALLGRVPRLSTAEAVGWKVIALPDLVYPGLVAAAGTVPGQLAHGLDAEDWTIVDAFENPDYDLVLVDLVQGSQAWAYTNADEAALAAGPWSLKTFAERDLAAYVERVKMWRDQFLDESEGPK
jgi:gamma-glutamylcyclotransferase (GGCT)/AIG2-like uncharacterized protein YtfP